MPFAPQHLIAARHHIALTQRQLADLVCVDRVTVARWECGAIIPSPSALTRLARALGVREGELFADDPSTQQQPNNGERGAHRANRTKHQQ